MSNSQIKNNQLGLFESSTNWKLKKLSYPNKTIRIGSLFSGIGAFEQALKKIKLKTNIIFATDNDNFVKETYFDNYNISEEKWFDDINEIKPKKYKSKIDLLVAGPPCQSFSMIGKRQGLKDFRGTLSLQYINFVNIIKPKVFIYENVRSLLTLNKGKEWKFLKKRFDNTGYSIFYDILNSRDFGIPQNRRRLFIIGFKQKKNFLFPKKTHLRLKMKDLLDTEFDEKFSLPKKGVSFVKKKKNIKKHFTQLNGEIALCQKSNQQFNWHGDFVEYKKNKLKKYYLSEKVKKYVLNSGTKNFFSNPKIDLKIARPLVSTMHKMHRSGVDNYVTVNKKIIRKLTPRECLRLMGFPENFKISVSDTQMYRQAGNSIVVDIIEALLKEMDISKYGI